MMYDPNNPEFQRRKKLLQWLMAQQGGGGMGGGFKGKPFAPMGRGGNQGRALPPGLQHLAAQRGGDMASQGFGGDVIPPGVFRPLDAQFGALVSQAAPTASFRNLYR